MRIGNRQVHNDVNVVSRPTNLRPTFGAQAKFFSTRAWPRSVIKIRAGAHLDPVEQSVQGACMRLRNVAATDHADP